MTARLIPNSLISKINKKPTISHTYLKNNSSFINGEVCGAFGLKSELRGRRGSTLLNHIRDDGRWHTRETLVQTVCARLGEQEIIIIINGTRRRRRKDLFRGGHTTTTMTTDVAPQTAKPDTRALAAYISCYIPMYTHTVWLTQRVVYTTYTHT